MIALYLACLENADDQRRFEEIWHACKRLVFHTAYTILRDEHLAEEITQETLCRAMEHWETFDGEYKIQRPFVFATLADKPLSDAAQKFFDYCVSSDAASIIAGAGAVPVAD